MLQKQYRLPASIRLRNSQAYSFPFFSLRITNNELSSNRYGFIVRKTVDKRAVVRNRIRRVFRSCIEELNPQVRGGKDMLFILNSKLLEMKREDLYNEVHSFFKEKQFLQ